SEPLPSEDRRPGDRPRRRADRAAGVRGAQGGGDRLRRVRVPRQERRRRARARDQAGECSRRASRRQRVRQFREQRQRGRLEVVGDGGGEGVRVALGEGGEQVLRGGGRGDVPALGQPVEL